MSVTGSWDLTQYKEVGLLTRLKPGDRIRMVITPRAWTGKTIGAYITAAKIYDSGNDPRFNILNWEITDENTGSITLNIEVVQNEMYTAGISPWIIALAIIGLSIAFVSVATYKVADVAGDLPDSPAGQFVAGSVPVLAIAALLFALWLWSRK